MSDLTFNKIAGAALATGLAIFLLKNATEIVFEKEPPEKMGYAITVAETSEGGAAAEAPVDWGTALQTADVAAGEQVTAKCKSCHNFEQGGANATGPDLYGVLGRKPASHGGYAYSAAMTTYASTHPVWDYEGLDAFLKGPQKDIPGTKMTFVGLKKQEDRINVIAYLHKNGGTLPIPAPNPAAAAAPAAAAGAAPAAAGAAPAPGAAPEGAPVAVPAAAGAPAEPAKPQGAPN